MNLRSEQLSNTLVLTADATRIDAACAIQFKDQMRELTANVSGRVVLDLSTVDFVDSSGLGAIVAAMKMLSPNHRLELAALSPTVDKVFRLTRMDTVFSIHQDLQAALAVDHKAD